MRFPAEQALYGAHYAKVTLERGPRYATWDLPTMWRWVLRNAIDAGMIPGPRMLVANYRDWRDGRACGSGPGAAAAHCVAGPILACATALMSVARCVTRSSTALTSSSSCFGGCCRCRIPSTIRQLTQEEMNAIVSEAHNWGARWRLTAMGIARRKWPSPRAWIPSSTGLSCRDDTLLEMKKKHVYLWQPCLRGLDRPAAGYVSCGHCGEGACGGRTGSTDVPACGENRRADSMGTDAAWSRMA